jgi:hypothetical protein
MLAPPGQAHVATTHYTLAGPFRAAGEQRLRVACMHTPHACMTLEAHDTQRACMQGGESNTGSHKHPLSLVRVKEAASKGASSLLEARRKIFHALGLQQKFPKGGRRGPPPRKKPLLGHFFLRVRATCGPREESKGQRNKEISTKEPKIPCARKTQNTQTTKTKPGKLQTHTNKAATLKTTQGPPAHPSRTPGDKGAGQI